MSDEFFTGVGARITPDLVCLLMRRFSQLQRRRARSGGANGADEAFETNWDPVIYLPQRGFRGKGGVWRYTDAQLAFADKQVELAYPHDFSAVNEFTRDCFRRNVWEVIGLCDSVKDAKPSDFLLCWTPDGALGIDDYDRDMTGGTGIAINIASLYSVKVYNLKRINHVKKITAWCDKQEKALKVSFNVKTGTHHTRNGEVWNPFDVFAY